MQEDEVRLATARIYFKNTNLTLEELKCFEQIIKDEINVKEIEWKLIKRDTIKGKEIKDPK